MPNRILKESVCVSDSIAGLAWFEEVLFYRLIVSCDDYGRYDGRTAVIRNRLFPLEEELTKADVEAALASLERAGLALRYEADGKPYLYLPGWEDHQNVRAKRSRYPAPPPPEEASAYICAQTYADAPVIQSESLSSSLSESFSGSEPAREAAPAPGPAPVLTEQKKEETEGADVLLPEAQADCFRLPYRGPGSPSAEKAGMPSPRPAGGGERRVCLRPRCEMNRETASFPGVPFPAPGQRAACINGPPLTHCAEQ